MNQSRLDARARAQNLARSSFAKADPTGWFERLYAEAEADPNAIPWADLRPNHNLTTWIEKTDVPPCRALVVGCGLGDDAEYLAARGFAVTAFDIAPTAVDWCRRRFPTTAVTYVQGDVLSPPTAWAEAFEFILECYTLQALPRETRAAAIPRLAGLLAPGGRLLVISRGREEDDPPGDLPWPLTRQELRGFLDAGLYESSFEDYFDGEDPPKRRFRVLYERRS